MASVRDFGASGTGEIDDTEAIQHAIENGDGLVEFTRGDYLITRSLVVDLARRGRTSFTGAAGTAKLIMAGPGPAIMFKGSHERSADGPFSTTAACARPKLNTAQLKTICSQTNVLWAHRPVLAFMGLTCWPSVPLKSVRWQLNQSWNR